MPFDGLTIQRLVVELNQELQGQRIEKIYQPEREEIHLVIRRKKNSARLVISVHSRWGRLYLSQEKAENPQRPSSFCMLLRKHLEGGKIIGLEQSQLDRIILIRIEALNDFLEWREKILYCEFTGKNSNIVLVDPETNLILDGIKRYGSELSSYREVLPGASYLAPPEQDKLNPLTANYDLFYQHFWVRDPSLRAAHALFLTFNGFSPQTSREICLLAGIDPDTIVGEFGSYELSAVYQTLQNAVSGQLNSPPVITMHKHQLADYFPFTPAAASPIPFDALNEAMNYYYTRRMAMERLESQRGNLLRDLRLRIDKSQRKLFFQRGDLEAAAKNNTLRVWGELLTAYAHTVEKGASAVVLQSFENDENVEIPLLPHLTAIENAQRYFKRYARSRKAQEHLVRFIEETCSEIDYLESVLLALEKAESIEELEEVVEELEEQGLIKAKSRSSKKSNRRSEPRTYMTSDGLPVLVGRNNRQNDWLTLKHAAKSSLWLHTQGFPGAHVILELSSKMKSIHDVPDAALEEAAMLAAFFSKGKEAEKVPVDYTFRENVKKPKGARPGMVVYDPYWTILINPSDDRLDALLSRPRTDPNSQK